MKTLKFTTTEPGCMGSVDGANKYNPKPEECDLDVEASKDMEVKIAYIHGEAENKAGYDIPVFFGGDLRQMEQPLEEQSIQMFIGDKVFEMKALLHKNGIRPNYLLILNTKEEIEEWK